MKPEFATNHGDQTVAGAISGHLEYLARTWRKPFDLGIATAYFNPGGFLLLRNALEQAGNVRLLLGAEPRPALATIRPLREAPPTLADGMRLQHALGEQQRDLTVDRDLLGFTVETDTNVRQLVEWLERPNVEVRRYERAFMHGKAFIVTTDSEGVVAGSSNFTAAGLTSNIELNLGHYQPAVVSQVSAWFDELWNEAEAFDLAGLYRDRFVPHNPYLIYIRMLFERYGAEIQEEAAAEAGGAIRLTTFQRDGLWRANRTLEQQNGVLIADGVGLGKSFIGGELMRQAVQDRRQRVLLVAPATLRDGPWRKFLERHQLGVKTVSFEELTADRQLSANGHGDALTFSINDYALVVIDEAHAYRNPDTKRAAALRRLLAGSPPKHLVLLTATPVNNSLWDLYYLLSYFIPNDAAFADRGIPSLQRHFAGSMAVDPEDLGPERLFEVLDAVAVRRTRHFVKRYYPNDTILLDGVEVPITFPKPVAVSVPYDLDEVLPGFFDRFAHALDCADGQPCEHPVAPTSPTLKLARYAPSAYRRGSDAAGRELALAGLLRSGLLKRFESSAASFARTCRRMAGSHDSFIRVLDRGIVPNAGLLEDWTRADTDADFEALLHSLDDSHAGDSIELFDGKLLRAAVIDDRDLLNSFAAEAERVTPDRDPKLRTIARELAAIAQQARSEALDLEDERTKRKVICFSTFADTIDWFAAFLSREVEHASELAAYRGRIVSVTGSDGVGGNRADAIYGFAPRSSDAPPGRTEDRFDLLLATDVLAEGVNLQQARHVINLDMPWNPMRLVQRHGRIDRIGSPHSRVWIRTVFPDRRLDALLQLEERLQRKIAQAAASVGVEGEVLPGSAVSDVVFTQTREEIERLLREDAGLFETAGEKPGAYSGEEYRQELRAALADPTVAASVRALAWGSGSGLVREGERRGFVFCARVGDHPVPVFRWVDAETQEVEADTLTCLSRAHADPATIRKLPDEVAVNAFPAWNVARQDIVLRWMEAGDPRAHAAAIPKALRDAAAIIRGTALAGVSQDRRDAICDALEAPYGSRIVRAFREAVDDHPTDVARAQAIIALVAEFGLQPPVVPEPLPVVTPDDVHLVCWMAVLPGR